MHYKWLMVFLRFSQSHNTASRKLKVIPQPSQWKPREEEDLSQVDIVPDFCLSEWIAIKLIEGPQYFQ